MKSAFYCNKPCTVIAYVQETGESIITLDHGSDGSYEDFPHTLIVSSRYVTEKAIDLEKEHADKLSEFNRLQHESVQNANRLIREEKAAIDKELVELRKRAKALSGMDQMLMLLEGRMKWILKHGDYCFELRAAEEWGYKDNQYDKELTLQAIVFRSSSHWGKVNDVRMRMSRWVDGSGNDTEDFRGFETEEEAINFAHGLILERLSKMQKGDTIRHDLVKFDEKYNLQIPAIQEYRESLAKKLEEQRQKEIEKAEKDLELLKAGKPTLKIPGY